MRRVFLAVAGAVAGGAIILAYFWRPECMSPAYACPTPFPGSQIVCPPPPVYCDGPNLSLRIAIAVVGVAIGLALTLVVLQRPREAVAV
jgi:hypothetical protein